MSFAAPIVRWPYCCAHRLVCHAIGSERWSARCAHLSVRCRVRCTHQSVNHERRPVCRTRRFERHTIRPVRYVRQALLRACLSLRQAASWASCTPSRIPRVDCARLTSLASSPNMGIVLFIGMYLV